MAKLEEGEKSACGAGKVERRRRTHCSAAEKGASVGFGEDEEDSGTHPNEENERTAENARHCRGEKSIFCCEERKR